MLNRLSPIECDLHHVSCETESKQPQDSDSCSELQALGTDVAGGAAHLQLLDDRATFQASLVRGTVVSAILPS